MDHPRNDRNGKNAWVIWSALNFRESCIRATLKGGTWNTWTTTCVNALVLSTRMLPACGTYMPNNSFKTVDFPLPLPPTRARTSPGTAGCGASGSARVSRAPRSWPTPTSPSWAKAEEVWCADNRNEALTLAKLDKNFDSHECDSSIVSSHYAMGQDVGPKLRGGAKLKFGFFRGA